MKNSIVRDWMKVGFGLSLGLGLGKVVTTTCVVLAENWAKEQTKTDEEKTKDDLDKSIENLKNSNLD